MALLRGINLGPTRRVPMADLRARLAEAGYAEVQTYVQSGNVVLDADLEPSGLATRLTEQLTAWFGFAIPVIVRTGAELAEIVERNPLGDTAENPKYHVVTFLDRAPDADALASLAAVARPEESLVHHEREIFTYYPQGQARSKLALALTDAKLGVLATARNFATVTKLAGMAAG